MLLLDSDTLQENVARIVNHAHRAPVSAVVGTDEGATSLASAASQALGLVHNTVDSISAAHDKYSFRLALSRAGLPSPRFSLISSRADLQRTAARMFYPCVLKPRSLSGSCGVIRANNPVEFLAAARRITAIVQSRLSGEHSETLLVEAFIPGREVALEGLLHNGRLQVLALFDKPEPLDGPFFEETVYVTPSRLPNRRKHAITSIVTAAAAALGLRSGPVHAELRVNAAGVWPVELAARSIGGRCAGTLSFGNAVPLEELILRQAVGLPTAHLRREPCASGVMMMPIPYAGHLLAIEGLEAARAASDIEHVIVDAHPGEFLVPLPEGDRYLGFLFARAESPQRVHAVRCGQPLTRTEHYSFDPRRR
jgi:biotin carboxylase